MKNLYPLKFTPIFMDKIWGGQKIRTELGKEECTLANCGESWEISGIQEQVSVVSNGFLAGNNLEELIEVYMGDLVGEKVFEKYGIEFPLLVKFIDANADLSIQVHPNDELSKERHLAYGKTEMWYILQADENSMITTGFNQAVSTELFKTKQEEEMLTDILNYVPVKKGDAFFVPAGTVHSIGKGVLLTEIQQASDVTYRIYDYDRTDALGNKRELHNELAIDAIDFAQKESYRVNYKKAANTRNEIVKCDYFTSNLLELDKKFVRDIYELDSFVIYICMEGECTLSCNDSAEKLKKGETILVPAIINQYSIKPANSKVKLLEVHL